MLLYILFAVMMWTFCSQSIRPQTTSNEIAKTSSKLRWGARLVARLADQGRFCATREWRASS